MKTIFAGLLALILGGALPCAPGRAQERAVPPAAAPAGDVPSYGGRTLDVWLEDLDIRPMTGNYRPAADAIRHMGAAALPALLRHLESPDEKTGLAVRAMQELGEAARPAVPRLNELLQTQPASGAADVLVRLGEEKQVIATLAVPKLRQAALGALTDKRVSEAAVGPIVPLLKDSDPTIRCDAAFALANIGKRLDLAAPGLIAAANDPDPNVRHWARTALQRLELPPKTLIPILIAGLAEPGVTPGRYDVCLQLGEVSRFEREKEDEVIAALIGRLHDLEPAVRSEAVWALGNLINGRMGGEHPDSRNSQNTLAGFETQGERIVAALAGMLKDPAKDVRGGAVSALADIGTTRTRLDLMIANVLRACLQDKELRSMAQKGLKYLPPAPEGQ